MMCKRKTYPIGIISAQRASSLEQCAALSFVPAQSSSPAQHRTIFAYALQLIAAIALVLCMCATCDIAWAESTSEHASGEAATAAGQAMGVTVGGSNDEEESIEEDLLAVLNSDDNSVNPRQTPDNSFLYDTSIVELTNADSSYQGKTVQITGEVIGDAIIAEEDPGKYWLTLESLEEGRDSSLSVLVDASTLELIDTYGVYGHVGTTLQIRGTFHLTCPSHEGIMDLHADTAKLVNAGVEEEMSLEGDRFVLGTVLLALGFALHLLYNHLRERER